MNAKEALAAAKKEELVRQQIKEKLSKINITKKLLPTTTKLGIKPLTVDSLGRVLDETGNVMQHRPMMHSRLKINQNFESERMQKEAMTAANAAAPERQKLEKASKKAEQSQYVDPSLMTVKKRRRMALNFVEPGSYIRQERQLQRQMEDKAMGINHRSIQAHKKQLLEQQERRLAARQKIELAGERGVAIDEVTDNVEEMNPNLIPLKAGSRLDKKDSWDDDEPWLEWWDRGIIILKTGEDPFKTANAKKHQTLDVQPELCMINEKKFNNYIEHPCKIDGKKKRAKEAPAIMLTKQERKKLRRRKREEKLKKIQDKIRVGLIPPPPPKLKLSNLMRVLKDQSVADPSRVEKQVREQMEERLRNHERRNEERKLTPEQRSKKHAKKWQVGKNEEIEAALFTIKSLTDTKLLFKVDINAQQFHLTGCCIVASHGPSVVVVEGSKLSVKRYIKLLMRRIKWEESEAAAASDTPMPLGVPAGQFCKQIWTGSVKRRNFSHWSVAFAECDEEITEILRPFKAGHYYEMVQKYRDPLEDI
ncbi:U4/U6 small nuclear ribonucleoprotein Prp3 [Babesia bigemina]|uniref:U4/U6 small nuclear ribonucleoprotein Prp3 n=1 Tax=Babesia bigemina TaxID=5866 RepID=A0A061D369_BABBI|nr:U4/U6 small nuclear ribonucleoprotein Prp3 [Babesia bigemina]CDR95053.1 U4/U6 small nuclear ribonucleoprotein Prp3 [Babesia bigemina]|eukprot:XP_012767239.1 U4/U6 small nuclear ribonucleoprotein Prp3 [Babesia bigemina]